MRGLTGTGRRIGANLGLWALTLLVVGSLAFTPPSAGGAPAPGRSGGASVAFSPAAALDQAAASLALGAGPAAGHAASCTGVGSGSRSCSVAGLLPLPSTASGAWVDVTGFSSSAPTPRWLGAMTYDAADGYVLLFGGENSTVAQLDSDTWTYSNHTWTELSPSNSPPGRYLASVAYDAADHYVVLFGGYDLVSTRNDTWTYSAGSWTNVTSSSTSAPASRWRANMVYDAADGYIMLFGGSDLSATTIYNDTWTFSAGTWTKTVPTGNPVGRFRGEMAYDSTDGYAVLFGGCTSSACSPASSDTWKYVGGAWTKLSLSTHPSARVYMALSDDPAQAGVLLFGGSSSPATQTPQSDTWLFANGTWTNLTSTLSDHPPARGYSMMTYDANDGAVILFGGANSASSLNDTWSFGPGLLGELRVTPAAMSIGQSSNISVQAASAGSWIGYSYPVLPSPCTGSNVSYVVCQPSAVGSYPISVSVNDSVGDALVLNSTLLVVSGPAILTFTASPSPVSVNTVTNLSIAATGGIPPVSYNYQNLPPGCSSQNRAYLLCTPSSTGVYTIEGIYSDTNGARSFANLTLTVNPAPTISSFSILPLAIDQGQSFNVSVAVSLGTTPYSYAYSGQPAGCPSVDASRLTCAAGTVGAFHIYANVTDASGAQVGASGFLTVNPALVATAVLLSPPAIDQGETLTIDVNASGGTGAYTYAVANAPPGCPPASTVPYSCHPSQAGNFSVKVTTTDQAGFSVVSFVSVSVNALPSVAGVAATPNPADLGMTVNLSATVTGGTLPLTYAWSSLPQGCAPADSATLACRSAISGSFSPSVRVTDGRGKTADSVVPFVVYPAVAVTLAVNPSPPTAGSSATFVANAQGGSSIFTFVWGGLPTGCPAANQSTIRCPVPAGSYTVTVRVTDTIGGSANATLSTSTVAASGGGSTFLGLPALEGYAVLGVVLVAVVAAAAVIMLRRRRAAPPAEPAPAAEPTDEM